MRPYTRYEFRKWLGLRDKRLGGENSPAFTVEPKNKPSLWFVKVAPVRDHTQGPSYRGIPKNYWDWCRENLRGRVLGYYSDWDNGIEWWGFTHKEDIVLWVLKWA